MPHVCMETLPTVMWELVRMLPTVELVGEANYPWSVGSVPPSDSHLDSACTMEVSLSHWATMLTGFGLWLPSVDFWFTLLWMLLSVVSSNSQASGCKSAMSTNPRFRICFHSGLGGRQRASPMNDPPGVAVGCWLSNRMGVGWVTMLEVPWVDVLELTALDRALLVLVK